MRRSSGRWRGRERARVVTSCDEVEQLLLVDDKSTGTIKHTGKPTEGETVRRARDKNENIEEEEEKDNYGIQTSESRGSIELGTEESSVERDRENCCFLL